MNQTEIVAQPQVPVLEASHIGVGYRQRSVITDLSLKISSGTVTALVGPNGSGKSTLLKALARVLAPQQGAVYLDGEAIAKMHTRHIAQKVGILPQGTQEVAGITVYELVEQGRYPHVGAMRMLHHQDHAAIHKALTLTGMTEFASRPLDSLSGGERQRAWIALALAQATSTLLLDEPTTFLDIRHQLEVLELIQYLNHEQAITILMVLHDLNQAARYAQRMVVMYQGEVFADGSPAEILTKELVKKVFGVQAHILVDPIHNVPLCLPYASKE